VFVVEQNRDAQMRSLLIDSFETDPAKLERVLHYDGTPITARFIAADIAGKLGARTGDAEATAGVPGDPQTPAPAHGRLHRAQRRGRSATLRRPP
jgi:hypothetical protein